MRCPVCNAWTTVLETRMRQDNTRRRTMECGNLHKFTTVERVEAVKHGGYRKRKGGSEQTNND
jgi:transcriptional regulator NrdR family protein